MLVDHEAQQDLRRGARSLSAAVHVRGTTPPVAAAAVQKRCRNGDARRGLRMASLKWHMAYGGLWPMVLPMVRREAVASATRALRCL
eukprot:2013649-Prymnesium_polylepis.1